MRGGRVLGIVASAIVVWEVVLNAFFNKPCSPTGCSNVGRFGIAFVAPIVVLPLVMGLVIIASGRWTRVWISVSTAGAWALSTAGIVYLSSGKDMQLYGLIILLLLPIWLAWGYGLATLGSSLRSRRSIARLSSQD